VRIMYELAEFIENFIIIEADNGEQAKSMLESLLEEEKIG